MVVNETRGNYSDVKFSAYNMACGINQKIIADMAREFEQDLIMSGKVPFSIIRQRKAEKMKLSEQKDSYKHKRVSEGNIIYGKGAIMPPYALHLMDIMDVFHPSDFREIIYRDNKVSIISGIEKKNYIIETKGGKAVGIRFKNKSFVEK
ncbi:hypothetical protein D4Q76_01645 [archaeon]|nr:MAG: hypothetical protein D4Q76_01645 [archaeon]